MSDSLVQNESNRTEQYTAETIPHGSAEIVEKVIFRGCTRMVTNGVLGLTSQKFRNVVDIEQISVDVLDKVIRKFRTHSALQNIAFDAAIPLDAMIEIRAFCYRVEKRLVMNAVRNENAGKRGRGIAPVSLDVNLEPMGATDDPGSQAECVDIEFKLRSLLDSDQKNVLVCRQTMMSNVEIAKETNISLRRVERLRREIKSIAELIFTDPSLVKQSSSQAVKQSSEDGDCGK